MNASDYISAMVSSNEAIYIDTASLMDVENMELFIENAEWILLKEHRRIIVPRAVCLELTRQLVSQNPSKRDKAARALDLLSNHVDIFEVRDENLREEEALKAFADSELLAELTLNRTACGQLLITNDRRLSEDAYKLNDQTSCRGRKVMVCFINKFGELRKCECTKEPVSFNQDKTIDTEQSNSPANDKIQAVPDSMPEQPINQQAHKLQIGRILIPIGTFAIGFLTSKYWDHATKLVKTLF